VESDFDFFGFMNAARELVTHNRPLRLRLDMPGGLSDDLLLPQRVFGTEMLCGGIEYRVLCVSASVQLPLKQLIAVPASLDIVTDSGDLRSVCGIVTEASSGDSDGGLASYQIVIRDAMAVLEKRINTRVFRNMDEVEIVQRILNEWRLNSAILGTCFRQELDDACTVRTYPKREFTMQHNESDADFIRRLLKRRGIGWYVRAEGGGQAPMHTLILFNNADSLRRNAAGSIRYHRDAATEERDSITSWNAVRTLQPGAVTLHSWDYRNSQGREFMTAQASSGVDQGVCGNELAASLDDYRILAPHAGDDNEDLCRLGQVRMSRHDYESKCFHGEGSVRDLCAGEYFTLAEHPEVDQHTSRDRDFIVTALQVTAQSNLPKALAARVERLFSRSRWMQGAQEQYLLREISERVASGPMRMHIQFTAVRRGVRIVPAYDARIDVPQAQMQSAIVVGPDGEEVHCDQMGRVKIRFPGTRMADHEQSAGAGASDSETDSAWVRVASNWAGNGTGNQTQCGALGLPRIGTEVLVSFLGGDPDKPIVVGQLYNQQAQPIALSSAGGLPGNRNLSGIKSREINGDRANQLRLDDTNGQISAQLASDHGASQLNLGFLTQPKFDGFGERRGEGVELCSREQMALRAAKGILLSAWKNVGRGNKQMARSDFLNLMADCTELAKSLGDYAADYQGSGTQSGEREALREGLASWENATEAEAGEGGKAMIAVSAPEGIAMATPKAIVSFSSTHIDTVAMQNLQMTAGQSAILNAGKGIAVFAQSDGIQIISNQGKLLMQSQNDETELNAAKDVKITATEGTFVAMAKEIVLIAEDGSFIKIGGGITLGTSGTITHNGASFPFKGPSTMAADLPKFGTGKTDLKFQARYYAHKDGGIPAPDLDIVTEVSDGAKLNERSGEDGETELIERDGMHVAAAKAVRNKEG
jgi:type VI secretion system secreted protein VgrG